MTRDSPDGRERLTVAALGASGTLTSLQFTLMVPALPDVPGALEISANDAAWLITITLLTGTVGTPILTRMADMYGRRRLLLLCLLLLGGGSIVAAVGMTFATALIGRGLQGVATAIVPIGISIMRDALSGNRATGAVALMSGTVGVGSALGLPLSGILVSAGGLPAIFWFSAVASGAFALAVAIGVPDSAGNPRGRFDLVGTALLTIALTAMLLTISKGLVWGWTSPTILTLATVAVVVFAIWVPQQLRNANPLIDLRTGMRRQVLQTNIATFFTTFGMFANHLLTMHEARAPLATGAGLGLPALLGGLIMLPSALAMVLMTPLAARMLRRHGGRVTLATGATIMAGAFLFRLLFHDGLLVVLLGALAVGIGTGLAFAAAPMLISDAVPRSELAAANGVNSLVRALAGAVTSALFALLVASLPWAGDPEFISSQGIAVAFGAAALSTGTGAVIAFCLPKRAAR